MKLASQTSIVLTGEQKRIIRSTRPVKQIVAAAGAAKTTVLTRIAERLIDEGAEPESILFLTALNSAKDVLRSAVRPDIECLTFHALGLHLLARSGTIAGLRRTTEPLSIEGQLQFLRAALKDESRRLKEDSPKTSKFLRELRQDAKKVRMLLKFIEWVRARGPGSAADAQEKGSPFKGFTRHLKSIKRVSQRFAKLKAKAGVIDYTDMIRLGRRAIDGGRQLKYAHVLVDEAQDCTPEQMQMLVALAPHLKSLTVVGDPLQSIQGFAGAGFTDLSELLDGVKTYPLTLSFRLTAPVAAFATALGRLVYPKLRPVRGNRPGGHRPVLVRCKHRAEHDQALVARVKHLIASGTPHHEITVIGRVKEQLREAEAQLLAAGIETQRLGRIRDPVHLKAILKLVEGLGKCGGGRSDRKKMRGVVAKIAGDHAITDKTIDAKVRRLMRVAKSRSFGSKFRVCADVYIAAKRGNLSKDAIADINRWAPISDRCRDATELRQTMKTWAAQGTVVTSHVHRAKGDEWDHVLILHAVQGSWPFFKARTVDAEVEELHALYVAATRARKSLFLFEGVYKNSRAKLTFSDPCSWFQLAAVPKCLRLVSGASLVKRPQ